MSDAAETVRDFFARLNAAGSTPSSASVKGTFLDSVEALLKERDDVLAALEIAVRIIEEAKPGAFDNGNSAYGTDEGDVLTHRWLAETNGLITKVRGS